MHVLGVVVMALGKSTPFSPISFSPVAMKEQENFGLWALRADLALDIEMPLLHDGPWRPDTLCGSYKVESSYLCHLLLAWLVTHRRTKASLICEGSSRNKCWVHGVSVMQNKIAFKTISASASWWQCLSHLSQKSRTYWDTPSGKIRKAGLCQLKKLFQIQLSCILHIIACLENRLSLFN